MSFATIFKLCDADKLDEKYLALKNIKMLCPSCTFGKYRKTPWRKEASKSGKVYTPESSLGSNAISTAGPSS